MAETVVVKTQSAVGSVTLWINVLTVAIAIMGHVSESIPDDYQPYIVAGLAIANAVLRVLKTKAPITTVV